MADEPPVNTPDHPAAAGLALDVDRLTWRPYGRCEPVLDRVNLTVPAGQHVLLVGPSGCGKSTLLRALAGVLETADSGERSGRVLVGGTADPAPGSVGLVLQDPGSGTVAATVARDVAFGLENRGVPPDDMGPLVSAALARVGLNDLAEAPTATLSGGQSQRLAVAGALALQPGALLLDEPLAMLDTMTRTDVVDVVARAAEGLTLVVVEHRLGPWLPHVDRLVVMDERGAIVADGEPRQVLAAERERLLDLGVWVPGVPDPDPVPMDPAKLFSRRDGGDGIDGRVVADGVSVDRTSRPTNRPPRVVRAVEDVTVDVGPGATTALVGRSGSGKSSLLLALAGLLRPVAGTVRVTGTDPAGLEPSAVPATVGWVPQSPAAGLVARTVVEELMTGPLATGMSADEADARADGLLEALALQHLRDEQTTHLSGGEQRRLAVAAAVAARPAVLLTDELTIGQDRHTWAAVVGLSEALARSGAAVVHATHDPALVARCDGIVPLDLRPTAPPQQARRTLAGRAGPLALVLTCVVAFATSLLVDGLPAGAAALGAETLLGGLALLAPGDQRLPAPDRLRAVGWRLGPMLLAALFVAWSTWLLGGHEVTLAAVAALKLLVAVVPSAVLLPLVDPDRLGDHLAQRLRLPARPVVAVAAALQRLQDMGELRQTLDHARRMRGLRTGGLSVWPVLLGVLLEVLGSAARLSLAMDARGFARARRRTWAEPAPWTIADTGVLLLGLVPLALALVIG